MKYIILIGDEIVESANVKSELQPTFKKLVKEWKVSNKKYGRIREIDRPEIWKLDTLPK